MNDDRSAPGGTGNGSPSGTGNGRWRRTDGGWELRFDRWLRHPPDRVWQALTTGEGLACWLADADIEAVPGGRMNLDFRQPAVECFPDMPDQRRQQNQVLVVEPLRRFDHTFGHAESIVSWRLAPEAGGTRLTLIHQVPRAWEPDPANTLAGWHHHLEGLDAAARLRRHRWHWPRFFSLRARYASQLEQENAMSLGQQQAAAPVAPIAQAGMLIRRPVAAVFRAFVDPAETTRFWFSSGSGPLAAGAEVTWTWAMYGVATEVRVKAIEPERRILIDWDIESDPTEVEWRFEPRGEQTWVTVENRGFDRGEDGVARALDSTGGFALVLGGAKVWLEHGIEPRFVVDRHPDARVAGWQEQAR
ncbi:MAG: SRPBCC domain-containing protein [Lautropia sp.]